MRSLLIILSFHNFVVVFYVWDRVGVGVSFFPFFFCFNFCRYSPVLLCPNFGICPSYTVEISNKKKKGTYGSYESTKGTS